MAAYAALVSLMNTVNNIQNHPHLSTSFDKYQTENLGEKLQFLLDFVERESSLDFGEREKSHCGITKEEVEDLKSQIAFAAHEAEDVIESHIVDQILTQSNDKSLKCLFDLQKVLLDMGFIKEKIVKVKEEKGFKDQHPKYSRFGTFSTSLTAEKTQMVGFDGYFMQLLDVLTGQQVDRQIISIVGMGGIDHEIQVPEIIKLWAAEGFLKLNRDQTFEEVAKGYIKDLIDRNLILVRKLGINGKVKTFNVHDLLRDLCIKVAEKENFFKVMMELDTLQKADREHCIVIHGSVAKEQDRNEIIPVLRSTSLVRSVIGERPYALSSKSRLLRVLHNAYADSSTIYQQVNLRHLPIHPANQNGYCWSEPYKIPSSISLLWNLQTLIIGGEVTDIVAPSEIWEMTQLRHLNIRTICLPDPPPRDKNDGVVLQNLQTLWRVSNFRSSEEVCRRIPNVKKLQIEYDGVLKEGDTSLSNHSLYNVGILNKLESLSYWFFQVPNYSLYDIGNLNKLESLSYWFYKAPNRDDLLRNLTFPKSLKKLSITRCGLHWRDLRIIGPLPHLEVLKLGEASIVGSEWNPVEGDFVRLKYLRIIDCSDLIYWNAESSHFPVLEDLVVQNLKKLGEIPLGIGEIPTLERICVYDCNIPTAISAMRILEEQESFGNQSLQVRVMFRDEKKRGEFKEKVEQEDFTNLNFKLYH